MEEKTLLILAAGMGSRFGGPKQTEPFGPNGEFIIDYSIYDAIESGFNKIVFIIKEENLETFKSTIGKRIENYTADKGVKVEYVFQNLSNIKPGIIPEDRVKPLGTAHAVLCAKDAIKGPFMIINADDFYGRDAFKVGSEFIDNMDESTIGLVGYKVVNTMTENGSVKRGVCHVKDGYLTEVVESEIYVEKEEIKAKALSDGNVSTIERSQEVSMNMICFPNNFFNLLEERLNNFLENSNLEKDEYLIPDVISYGIETEKYKVKVCPTKAQWAGVTYREDKEKVVFFINSLIEDKVYPQNLWK